MSQSTKAGVKKFDIELARSLQDKFKVKYFPFIVHMWSRGEAGCNVCEYNFPGWRSVQPICGSSRWCVFLCNSKFKPLNAHLKIQIFLQESLNKTPWQVCKQNLMEIYFQATTIPKMKCTGESKNPVVAIVKRWSSFFSADYYCTLCGCYIVFTIVILPLP